MATKKKTTTGKGNKGGNNGTAGKATMYNTSRFDDDGYGIRNLRKPGDNKKTGKK